MRLPTLFLLPLLACAQHNTTPDTQARFHSLCLIQRPPAQAWAACRIEDDRQPGFENYYHIEVMSPLLRLDVPERFETDVTVAAEATGSLRVTIEHWGSILMLPMDSEIREAQRFASRVRTKDGYGFETIKQGVTIQPVGDGQYTITFDHVGRGF